MGLSYLEMRQMLVSFCMKYFSQNNITIYQMYQFKIKYEYTLKYACCRFKIIYKFNFWSDFAYILIEIRIILIFFSK